MPTLFDTHCHLEPEDDPAGMVARASAAGVTEMLIAGAKPELIAAMLARIAPFPGVYAAVGVHPHEAGKWDGELAPYRAWATHPQVRAIGELGLDYFYNDGPKDMQQRVFRAFLQLAKATGKPAIVHCREAYEDVYTCLHEELGGAHPFVIHCFSGTVEWAQRYLALGGYLSFTGIITFPKAGDLRAVLPHVPLDRLMFETDSPYLTPVPFRGKRRNEPSLLPHVVATAATVLGLTPDALASSSTAAARRFYSLPV